MKITRPGSQKLFALHCAGVQQGWFVHNRVNIERALPDLRGIVQVCCDDKN